MGEKHIFVPRCSSAQRYVVSAWREKCRQVVSRVRGVCDDVTCPFLHSGVAQVLKAGQVDTNDPFCCPNIPLQSSYILDLLADPNQTVCDMLNFFSWWRKNSLCWAFFTVESMWVSHFSSWEMVVPRNLNDSTAATVLFMVVSGGSAGGFLLKSTIISTVLSVLSSKLFLLHQTASCSTSCLSANSSPSWMRAMAVVSSANFRSLTEGSVEV